MRSLKQRFCSLAATASILIVALPASVSASLISLNPTTATSGLVSGDVVSFDISLDFSDVGGTLGGGFDVVWDSSLLGLSSFTQNAAFGNPLNLFFPTLVSDPVVHDGRLGSWSFVDFSGVQSGILGSVEFNVLSTKTIDTIVSVTEELDFFGGPWVGALSGVALDPQPDYNSVTVGIVPSPATLSLLAIGFIGLVGIRRREQI